MTIAHETAKMEAERYLSERCGTYEQRTVRYSAVAQQLFWMGMNDSHTLFDLGAGMCDFDVFLRNEMDWRGRYVPVDKSIDGTDVERWRPVVRPDFITAIELVEHLRMPIHHMSLWLHYAKRGVVLTTPNTDHLGRQAVLDMDRTHMTPVYQDNLNLLGFRHKVESFFGGEKDSIIAWREC